MIVYVRYIVATLSIVCAALLYLVIVPLMRPDHGWLWVLSVVSFVVSSLFASKSHFLQKIVFAVAPSSLNCLIFVSQTHKLATEWAALIIFGVFYILTLSSQLWSQPRVSG